MLLEIHPDRPNERLLQQVVDTLNDGGVIIYPTDTVYGIGCDINNKKAVERVCQLRGLDPAKAQLSFICENISQVAGYTTQIDNELFRLMKQVLPGPYTFILKANHQVPKILQSRRATVGVRIPDHSIPLAIVRLLGRPILTTSLKADDDLLEYYSDAYDIHEDMGKRVDIVIDGGVCGNVPSTVIDGTTMPPVLVRQGAGPVL